MTKNAAKPVCKPYIKGKPFSQSVLKRGLKLLGYQLIFIVFYLLLGVSLSLGNTVIRVLLSLVLLLVCAALVWVEGAKTGDGDVGSGQIAYNRRESGKALAEKDIENAFHPLKGLVTALIAAAIPFLICLVYALICEKETYVLQSLPSWVGSLAGEGDYLALDYYNQTDPMGLRDILRIIVRTCIYPFVNMIPTADYNGRLIVDRLSPILVTIPFLAYAGGYLTGPGQRAGVQGSIDKNNARARKKRMKQERRKAEREQKNRLI